MGEWGPVPAVGRPPARGLETDVEPTTRPAPPQWRGGQEALRRQPRTSKRRGRQLRKERLPEMETPKSTFTSQATVGLSVGATNLAAVVVGRAAGARCPVLTLYQHRPPEVGVPSENPNLNERGLIITEFVD